MASDKDDHNDLDMDMGMDDADNNIIDVEGFDEPLSATPLGAADEYDEEGDDEYADEAQQLQKPKKKGGMTKVVAPLLVLLAAAGVGGYIVMNPSILGGSPSVAPTTVEPAVPATDTAMLPPPDASTPPADATGVPPDMPQEIAAVDTPPQPLANVNEAPPADVSVAPVPEITPDTPVPDVTPDQIVDATAPVSAEVPAPDAPVQDTAEVIAGTDIAVDSTAVNVQAPDTTVTPEVAPEATPASEPAPTPADAPAVAEVPVAPETPAVTPETPPATAPADTIAVTEPTFVPAPPADQPAEAPPVSVADAAVPPVMNVQEVPDAAAPEMPPRTVTQTQPAPTSDVGAANGQVSAAPATPAKPEVASNVYYDSLSQVPVGAMATSVGPREVNPVLEPASKMVVVTKDKNETSQESLLVSANRALKLQRYDAALEMYDQLYAKNKRDTRILMGRAVAQQNMGLNESAIQSYEEVLALKPNSTEALVNMMGLVRKQYPEIALRRLLELYSKHPNNAGIAAQIGVTNAELGHFDDAMRYLGIASTLEPNNAQHLFNMAIAADRGGNRAQAIQFYERALEVDVMYGNSRSVPRERIYDRLSVLRRG